MALTITNVTTATSITSSATLDVTGITAAVGDTLILACAADDAGTAGVSSTSATITDAAGNTWTRLSETNRTQAGNASDGTTLSIWRATLGFTLSSATITINFSPNTTAKTAILYKVVPGAGEVVELIATGPGVTGSASAFSSGNVNVDSGQYIFGFTANESRSGVTRDSDTTNGSWSAPLTEIADSGVLNTSQRISGQWKLATASGNQSYDTAAPAARDYALNYLILGGAGTASGATIAAASSAIDGAAAGAAGVSGTTLSDTVALLDGAGTGGATAPGDLTTAATSLTVGQASGAATAQGVELLSAASLIAGLASGGDAADAEADGSVIEVTAGLISGIATGVSAPPAVVIGGGVAWRPHVRPVPVNGHAQGSLLVASATLIPGWASGKAAASGMVLQKSSVAVLAGRAHGDATVRAQVIESHGYAARYDNEFLLLAA